jgi:hypothetical protein
MAANASDVKAKLAATGIEASAMHPLRPRPTSLATPHVGKKLCAQPTFSQSRSTTAQPGGIWSKITAEC